MEGKRKILRSHHSSVANWPNSYGRYILFLSKYAKICIFQCLFIMSINQIFSVSFKCEETIKNYQKSEESLEDKRCIETKMLHKKNKVCIQKERCLLIQAHIRPIKNDSIFLKEWSATSKNKSK